MTSPGLKTAGTFSLSAELSYLQGAKLQGGGSQDGRERAPDLFLQSAVFAYYYLLGDGREPLPSAYDIRFREACDLYYRALRQAFPANENEGLILSRRERHLPVGNLELVLKTDTLTWRLENFCLYFVSRCTDTIFSKTGINNLFPCSFK